MMLEEGVAEYLSYMKIKPAAFIDITVSSLFHKRKMIQEFTVWLTFNR